MPIAYFVGRFDLLATVLDNRQNFILTESVTVHYGEHDFGHIGFMTSKDMSYFKNGVLKLLKEYH